MVRNRPNPPNPPQTPQTPDTPNPPHTPGAPDSSAPARAGLIARLLPSEAISCDVFGDILDAGRFPEARLFPEEEASLARAVDKRRREFTTVRACARRALAGLGFEPVPIPRGPRGAPNWPTGVVGSMTHCDGYRAATVAREREIASLGIDAEPASPLPEGTFGMVALGPEREHLAALTVARPGIAWDRLLFCAKESVYKAWFPLTGRWLGFEEAQVELNLTDHPDDPGNRAESGAEGTFTARLLVPGPSVDGRTVDRFSGRWLMHDGIVAAAVIVEH